MFSIFSNKYFIATFFFNDGETNPETGSSYSRSFTKKNREASVQAAWGAEDRKHLEAQKNCGAVVE